ncbi:MAG: uroporphyrinogen decarboxylase [Thermoanaerobaculales bacterium]|jgi:uroporphyrinogen decarboxylase|nr:uroporphyrinogen decarboxylase [Thermoanaerobaculales bacterium]
MRQAGRYLPEYREVRTRAGDFLTMCRTPEIAAEVTLQPIRRFGLDAAIVFSDILTPLVPAGIELDFAPAPHIANPLRTPADLDRLRFPEPWSGTEFLSETLALVREALAPETALIGFCGAPWTLGTYLVEGSTSRSFSLAKAFAHHHPGVFDALVNRLADAMAAYLRSQVEAGAQAVQVFDSWIGALGAEDARRWALGPARRLLEKIGDLGVPRIYFANGGAHLLHDMRDMPCEVIGLDWRADLAMATRALPDHALQGNLDPGVLMGPDDAIRARTLAMVAAAPRRGYIANLGHGVTPDVPVRAVSTFVETIQRYRYE